MAYYRKVGAKWVCEIVVNGKRKSKRFESKLKAKAWAAQSEHELRSLSDGVSRTHTMSDLFDRYAAEVSDTKKGARWEIIRLNRFKTYALADVKLIDIRREHLEHWINQRLKSVKSSSVNRELNLLSHCLTQARRWRLMDQNPMADLKRPKNPPHRDRRISHDEVERVLICLNYSEKFEVIQKQQCVAVAFLFAIETAMRAGEICSLRIENINFEERTAFLSDTKNGLPRYVPLTARATELIGKLPEKQNPVFGLNSGALSTVFRKAVINAGIDNLTFHDARHEAITRLASKLDVLDLARAVGHRDIKQLQTYYNKSAADIAKRL
ncbi:tyrosine-type recombinase/integrase [bacterium]|nr:tyrosine-type recombinase/integrase [bacterium]